MRLNLAQLLFMRGDKKEPRSLLSEALSTGLSDSDNLEAQFYRLAHTHDDPADVVISMRESFRKGARLKWNVSENIRAARAMNPTKADQLELLWQTLRGTRQGAIEWRSSA